VADNIEVLGVLKLQPDQRSIDEMAAAIQAKLSKVATNPSGGTSGASGGVTGSGPSGTTPAPETKPVPAQSVPKVDTGKTIGDAVERAIGRSRFGQAADRLRAAGDSFLRLGQRAGTAVRGASVEAAAGRLGGAGAGGLVAGGAVAAGVSLIAAVNRIGKQNMQQLLADSDVSPAGARIALIREIQRRENALIRSNIAGDSSIQLAKTQSELARITTIATSAIADKIYNPIVNDLGKSLLWALKQAGLYSPQSPVDVNVNTRIFYQRAVADGYRSPPPIPGMVQIRP